MGCGTLVHWWECFTLNQRSRVRALGMDINNDNVNNQLRISLNDTFGIKVSDSLLLGYDLFWLVQFDLVCSFFLPLVHIYYLYCYFVNIYIFFASKILNLDEVNIDQHSIFNITIEIFYKNYICSNNNTYLWAFIIKTLYVIIG